MRIVEDDLRSPAVAELLREHVDGMLTLSPAHSVHTMDLEALRSADVSFWTAWDGEKLLGCGALKEMNPDHAEIKSMRTAKSHLGKGVATAILQHMIVEARNRGYLRLSLETGSAAAFVPAHALYQKFGFDFCEPFGDYQEDPHSKFMTLALRAE